MRIFINYYIKYYNNYNIICSRLFDDYFDPDTNTYEISRSRLIFKPDVSRSIRAVIGLANLNRF